MRVAYLMLFCTPATIQLLVLSIHNAVTIASVGDQYLLDVVLYPCYYTAIGVINT